jgi:hypothetical protein
VDGLGEEPGQARGKIENLGGGKQGKVSRDLLEMFEVVGALVDRLKPRPEATECNECVA